MTMVVMMTTTMMMMMMMIFNYGVMQKGIVIQMFHVYSGSWTLGSCRATPNTTIFEQDVQVGPWLKPSRVLPNTEEYGRVFLIAKYSSIV